LAPQIFISINNTKKKMKRFNLIYTLLALALSGAANAQTYGQTGFSDGRSATVKSEKSSAVTGSKYLDEKYLPAKVENKEGTILLRYNAYDDSFEYNNPETQSTETLEKEAGVSITFANSGTTYEVVDYKTNGGDKYSGYLNVISDNEKVKIYKREYIIYKEARESSNSYQASKPAAYKRASDEFYVKIGANEANYFDGKKDFAKLIPGKEKEVLDYIKKNKIDTEKDADLQKLATYVETLI
jgi:hypothetical protein